MRLLPLTLLAALAACADSEAPDAVPANDNGAYNVVEPVRAPLRDEGQPTIGQWIEMMQEERPALQFGPPHTEPLFSLRCDDRGGLLLNRHGIVATGTEMMAVTIGAASRRLAVNPVPGPLPMLRAAIPAQDELLAQLGASPAFRIVVGDSPELALPASPLVGQFVATCATSEATGSRAEPSKKIG
ncbi:MAG: hypothetical protein H0W74_08135 [Sphingosinicella sp.]|nr:hypothetical protein [Sphingosinicella sp.]